MLKPQPITLRKGFALLFMSLFFIIGTAYADTTFIKFGSTWKYLADGSNQGTAWRASVFADGTWPSGPAQFGYGDGAEKTVVGYGPNPNAKFVTTYYRTTVNIPNPALFTGFIINMYLDDGAVVYVNGTARVTNNVAAAPAFNALATGSSAEDGHVIQSSATLPIGNFMAGINTIAVEVHQRAITTADDDCVFDLELRGMGNPAEFPILRGPLLQMVAPDAVTIKWRTGTASSTRIKYGTDPNNLTSVMSNAANVTEHELRLTGLSADTKYYYAVGSGTSILEGSYRNSFITTPPASTTRKIRLAVFGDAGKGTAGGTQQKPVRNGMWQLGSSLGNSEISLMLGDNAYDNGTDAQHQTNFFDIYDDNMFDNTVVFPVPGNHEYDNTTANATSHAIPYYQVFTLPTAGELGGFASGTEHYYSFNYGNIHFIMLDSYGIDGGTHLFDDTTAGQQAVWLKNDLAVSHGTRKWTIVCLHHPPYTNGTHTSDGEVDLIAIRQKINPILERFGVDLVLAGHSHVYERSFLVKGHTGTSGTFNTGPQPLGNRLSNSSAVYDGSANSCPYYTIDTVANHGTVYVVAGSSGQIGASGTASYPVFYYRNQSTSPDAESGGLIIEIEDNRLDAKFIGGQGIIKDRFTIMKDVNRDDTLTMIVNTPTPLIASWIGSYNWVNSVAPASVLSNSRTFMVTPSSPGTFIYYVKDSLSPSTTCMSDSFVLKVNPTLPVTVSKFEVFLKNHKAFVQWRTDQEENSDYFLIERSANGRDFEMIMIVRAAGNSNTPINYEFQDNYPLEGNNYYRLTNFDKDGRSKIVGIRMVVNRIDRSYTVSINPNPAINGEIKAVIQSNKRQTLKIRIIDIKGAEIYKKNFTASEGTNNLTFHVKAGTYILNIEAQDGSRLNDKILVK
jgi:acid phosphatase type 7